VSRLAHLRLGDGLGELFELVVVSSVHCQRLIRNKSTGKFVDCKSPARWAWAREGKEAVCYCDAHARESFPEIPS
jgi:hypothetical protein